MICNSTPHIKAVTGDFARTVLMPGDPLRSKLIAETYLESPELVNNVRGVQGYTGYYKGVRLSVMASGMGIPSMGIYSHELFNMYDVENIIRIGSAGAIRKDISLRDIVIGQGVSCDSNWVKKFRLPGSFAPLASYDILEKCVTSCRKLNMNHHVGNILSSNYFYSDDEDTPDYMKSIHLWSKMGVMAIEMESAALYMNAARYGKNALAICTISDNLLTNEALTSDERHTSFTNMIEVALETAIKLEN